jgi:hypothetical protein
MEREHGVTVESRIGGVGSPDGSRLSGWLRLGLGLGVVWVLAYILLPWASGLSPVRPIMEALAESGADPTLYFYTQSEETALAQMYVRNALAHRDVSETLAPGRDDVRP